MQELVTRVENMTEKVRKLIEQNERLRRHNAFLVVENENLSEEVATIRQAATQLEQELQDKLTTKTKEDALRYAALNADYIKATELAAIQGKEANQEIAKIKAALAAQQLANAALQANAQEATAQAATLLQELNELRTSKTQIEALLANETQIARATQSQIDELHLQIDNLAKDTTSQTAILQEALDKAQTKATEKEQEWQDKMRTILEDEQRREIDAQQHRHQLELHLRAMEQCIEELYKQPKKG